MAQPGWPAYLLLAIALLAIVGGVFASRRGSEKAAFMATAIAIAATVGSLFASLFPGRHRLEHRRRLQPHHRRQRVGRLRPHRDDDRRRRFFPLVLLYQGYTYIRVPRRTGIRWIHTTLCSRPKPRPEVPAGVRDRAAPRRALRSG